MTTMTILSILLVVSFMGATIWKLKALPDSISAMVYVLPSGGWRWLWTLWLLLVGILTTAPMIEILDHKGCGYLGFITLVCLVFVGAWPLFQTETRRWHYIGAFAAGLMSQVCVFVACAWWWMLWLLVPVLLIVSWKSKRVNTFLVRINFGLCLLAEFICYASMIAADAVH